MLVVQLGRLSGLFGQKFVIARGSTYNGITLRKEVVFMKSNVQVNKNKNYRKPDFLSVCHRTQV